MWWHQYLHCSENWHHLTSNIHLETPKGSPRPTQLTTWPALGSWQATTEILLGSTRFRCLKNVHPKGWLPRCWPLDPPKKKWLKYCKWSSKVHKALPSGCCSWKIEGKVFFLARSPAASGWVWDIFTCNYQAGACKISDLDQGNSLWIGFSQAYHFQSELLQKSPSSSGGPPSSNLLVM